MKRSIWLALGLAASLLCGLTVLARLPTNQLNSRGIYVMYDNIFNNLDRAHGIPVSGGTMRWGWNELEPTKGNYQFDQIRSFVSTEASRGKKAGIGIETYVGRINQTAPYGALRVPQWLYQTYPSVAVLNPRGGSEITKYYVLHFLDNNYKSNYATFINALADWLAANPDVAANVAWVEIGVGMYSETQPADSTYVWDYAFYADCTTGNLCYSANDWLAYVNWCTDTYKNAFRVRNVTLGHMPLYLNCAPDFKGTRTSFSNYAASRGLGLKNNGLQADRRPASLYGPLEYWSTIVATETVPIAWETYEQWLYNETLFYWGMLAALDKHPDMIMPDRGLFLSGSTVRTRYVEIWNWVDLYLGVTPWTTPSVWCALRDTNPPDSGGERGNFSFFLFQGDDYGPNGVTVPAYEVSPGLREGAWTRRTDQGTGNRYMWFRIADQYVKQNQGTTPFTVIITYLDSGTDTWQFWYDSTTGLKSGGSVTKTGSNQWKKATFILTDANFNNAIGSSSDLALDCNNDGDEYFHMVDVRKGAGITTPSPSPSPSPSPTRTQTPVVSTLQGSVTLQRPGKPAPDPSWAVPLLVSIGGMDYPVTTDQTGAFTLNNLTAGTYNIRVKNSHTLANVKNNVTLNSGTNTVSFGTLLEGDANDNNCVNITDFSILASYFNPAYDARADFNGDALVNIMDFSLLAGNFGLCGDLPSSAPSSPASMQTSLEPAVLRVEPATSSVVRDDLFSVDIVFDTGGSTFDRLGVELHMDFDPMYLQVVGADGQPASAVQPGSTLDALIQNSVSNAEGHIDFAAGTFSESVSGVFSVATVRLRALQRPATGSTTLRFVTREQSPTDARVGGESVLGGTTDGVVFVRDEYRVYLPLLSR